MLHSFHAKLETNYLNGKVNRRVDFLIDALLRIEEDCFFKVAQKQRMGIVNQQEIKESHRHQRGLQIKPEDVTLCNDLLYIYPYRSRGTTSYSRPYSINYCNVI